MVREVEALDGIAGAWRRLATTPAADPDYYLACLEATEAFVRPHVILLERDGEPTAVLAGSIQDRPLELKIGYRKVGSLRARFLTVEPGAACGDLSEASSSALVGAICDSLRAGEADVAMLREVPADSPLARLARCAPGILCRDGCPSRNVRWMLSLPESPEAPPTLSAHTRRIGRYATKRLLKRYGERVRVEVFRDPADLERAMADLETVASRAYQRRLGTGFVADAATRRRASHEMERGWFRAFVLYIDERPCAFWTGIRYGDTFYARQTAYDPEFGADQVGKALLVWKIEALQREGGIRAVDWGFGDADYKSHYGTDRFEEATIAVFAPSLRGLSLNAGRSAVGQTNALVKAAARKADVFQSLQMRARRRMMAASGGNQKEASEEGSERPGIRARLRDARKRLVRTVNGVVAPLETIGARGERALPHPVIFVVGPPRSGTTILVQLIDAAFDVAIFTNLLNALWGVPSFAAAVCRRLDWRGPPQFRSDLGNTPSWLGFSEGPNYWLRFFPETPHVVAPEQMKPEDRRRLRAAVARLVRAFGKPVAFKTIANTGRIRPLAAALPEALFIVSRRDPVAVAHSILEARHTRHGAYDTWLSLEPSGIEELRPLPAHEQAVEQVVRIYDMIDRDIAAIGAERFLEVQYEDLCADPRATVGRIERFASLPPAEESRRSSIPERFERRTNVRIPAALYDGMQAYYRSRLGRIS